MKDDTVKTQIERVKQAQDNLVQVLIRLELENDGNKRLVSPYVSIRLDEVLRNTILAKEIINSDHFQIALI